MKRRDNGVEKEFNEKVEKQNENLAMWGKKSETRKSSVNGIKEQHFPEARIQKESLSSEKYHHFKLICVTF